MKKVYLVLPGLLVVGFLQSCNEDKVKDISKNGSIETSIKVEHLNDNFDIIRTTSNIWFHDAVVQTIVHNDTIPTLGETTEEAENDNGDVQNVRIKKDYELYITVK